MTETARLQVFNRDEWFNIVRHIPGGLERDKFDRMWADFCRMKEARASARPPSQNN